MQDVPEGQSLGGGSSAASAEEIRRRRLAALEQGGRRAGNTNETPPPSSTATTTTPMDGDDDDTADTELEAALAFSLEGKGTVNPQDDVSVPAQLASAAHPPVLLAEHKAPLRDERSTWVDQIYETGHPFELAAFQEIMWDDQMTTESDKNRWISQGIDVRKQEAGASKLTATTLERLAESHLPWGLVQQHGGPCGVLAVIQAELLRVLLNNDEYVKVEQPLARAMAVILARATLTPSAVDNHEEPANVVRIVLPTTDTWQYNLHAPSTDVPLNAYSIPIAAPDATTAKRQKTHGDDDTDDDSSLCRRIDRLADLVEAFLSSFLHHFQNPGGVLLFVMSLTASRSAIRHEFDDPVGTRLTAQFGHCGQELMNLLLTGQAVSNVFDNTLSPSGDMVCRGIQSRPAIGYLSQLEAMRYCEVGGYYKSPLVPIWVVGSTSHFTVLFGEANALKESKSDMLLDECRRAFKAVEGGEENGFIQTSRLGTVLKTLNIDLGGDEASRIQTLAASLEVGGAGIILWDDFWKVSSRLMTGASLETVLQDGDGTDNDPLIVDDDEPPPLIANFPANETDEEMARRLGAEWGSDGMNVLSAAATAAMDTDAGMSDEDFARKLQAQFDSENAFTGSVDAVNGSPVPQLDDDDDAAAIPRTITTMEEEEEVEDAKPPAQPTPPTMEFEQFGETFSLWHYNGLRGGVLTPFRITRLTAVEAVGASVGLNRGGATSGGGSQDLEDVVRTKWPSCSINWLGKQPPYID